ncbi:MAG: ABC transporter permease subunit [Firmicutes bacterium]|nr:ABC transporter permease subunit [Bacillota bacterium]
MEKSECCHLYLVIPLFLVLLIFLIIPLFYTLKESFITGDGVLTFQYYKNIFIKPLYKKAIFNSLKLAVLTTLFGSIIGGILSYIIFKMKSPIKELLLNLNNIPLTFSGLVIAFSFIITYGTSGFITTIISKITGLSPLYISDFLISWKGLLFAYLFFLIPRMILIMMVSWSNFDWNLIEAAENLGASRWIILKKVLLPGIAPTVLAGTSVLFAVSMGAFGTAFALTGTGVNILPLLIYTNISEVNVDIGQASTLAIGLVIITSLVIYIYQKSLFK